MCVFKRWGMFGVELLFQLNKVELLKGFFFLIDCNVKLLFSKLICKWYEYFHDTILFPIILSQND